MDKQYTQDICIILLKVDQFSQTNSARPMRVDATSMLSRFG